MASMASSDPLSSPDPTPPPQPRPQDTTTVKKPEDPGLDAESDLSALSDEDQEGQTPKILDDDEEVAESPEPDGSEADADDEPHQPSHSRTRKKRRSLVPEPMWDWAYKPKKEASKGKDVEPEAEEEEEEEEEQPGPPRPMEEEEDEDEDPRPSGHRGHHNHHHKPAQSRVPDEDPDEGEDVDGAPPEVARRRDVDEEESVGGRSVEEPDEDEEGESEAGADTDDMPLVPPTTERSKLPPAPDSEDEDEAEDDVDVTLPKRSVPAENDVESENEDGDETASEDGAEDRDQEVDADADVPTTLTVSHTNATPSAILTPVNGDLTPMDLDVTAPSPATFAPVAHAAAVSSIMAGSEVIEPPSPSPSVSSSRSASPSERKKTKTKVKPSLDQVEKAREAKVILPVEDAEIEAEAEGDVEPEAEEGVAEVEGDQEDMEVDDRDLETEADLQPAHRAEALDVLATIEFKFAMLRERVYVEKMEALAWEENLIADNTHPELLHLHTELSKRRDKRLDLADKRRSCEVANTLKRRRAFEDGVWSWWKNARDELQIDMIAETNRKRRKLERERRAVERPQPVRRIPNPPHEIPVPPTLHDIVNNNPFSPIDGHKRSSRNAGPVAYPTLTTLTPSEIATDLEFLYANRRGGPFGAPVNMGLNAPGMPLGYEAQYGMGGAGLLDTSPFGSARHAPAPGFPRRQPPGPSGLHHEIMEQEMMPAPGMGPMHMPPGGHVGVGPSYMQHPAPGPGPGPGHASIMSRSISPVHVMGGAKVNGWTGRRMGEEEMREREREMMYRENNRELGLREEMDREKERRERNMDMSFAPPSVQQQQQQRMQHAHVGPGQVPHVGPHHHHHHFHHVHHHHHPTTNPPTPNGIQAPPMSPLHQSPGHSNSPRMPSVRDRERELEMGRPRSGPPSTEVINLSSSSSASKFHPPGSGSMPYWRDDREAPPDPNYGRERDRERDRDRERVRPPPALGPHERVMTPFVMTPSQAVQNNMQSGGRHPASSAPSRRGSPDGPSRSNPQNSSSHTLAGPSSLPPRLDAGPMSPPRSMSRLPPPPSPSGLGLPRSPPRPNIPLPPPPYPAGLDGHFSKNSIGVSSPNSKGKSYVSPSPTKMIHPETLGRSTPPPRAEMMGPAPPPRQVSPPHLPEMRVGAGQAAPPPQLTLHRLPGPPEGIVPPLSSSAVPPLGDAS